MYIFWFLHFRLNVALDKVMDTETIVFNIIILSNNGQPSDQESGDEEECLPEHLPK